MRLHYGGKYVNSTDLPTRDLPEGSVRFKEPDSVEKLGRLASIISVSIFIIMVLITLVSGFEFKEFFVMSSVIGVVFALVLAPVHELLHAICFRGDVYLFTNVKQGMLFVVGIESMSKFRFVFMSLLPNIILGLIPYILFLFNKNLVFLGVMGLVGIPAGAGDYLNVWNAVRQMPKGAKTFISGINSYWYMG